MSSSNGQPKSAKKEAKSSRPKVTIHVAPTNRKASREVVAKWGDREEFIDVLDPFRAAAREKYVRRLAEAWKVEPDRLRHIKKLLVAKAKAADDLADQAAPQRAEEDAEAGAQADPSARALEETPEEVREAAEAFLKNPKMMDELAKDFEKLGMAGETEFATTEYIIATSRLLDRPLGGSVKASSSSGKSYVTEIVSSLMPEEALLVATDITPNALYYLLPGSLRHKLVVVGERKHMSTSGEADAANATLALREMMSRGRLDKYVPMHVDGVLATAHVVQEGPIAYLETTTQQEVYEEDATRMLSLATNESPEQTAAIMAIQAKQAAWATASSDEQAAIRAKHQTAQRLLKRRRVRIPFAERLALPSTKLVARRAFPQLLGVIEAVALLRQRIKTESEDSDLAAHANDYEIAYRLMLPVLQRALAPLSKRALDLLAVIVAHRQQPQIFTRTDCKEWAGIGTTETRNRLNLLVEAGLVEQVKGDRGVRYEYKVLTTRSASPPSLAGLITPAELRKQLEEAKKATKPAKKKAPTSRK
jgi:hypothetical protein